MAKVFYSNGIDYISGALNKVKKGGQHDHEKMREDAVGNPPQGSDDQHPL